MNRFKEKFSIWLDRWRWRICGWIENTAKAVRIRLGRVRDNGKPGFHAYCPGCGLESIWTDYRGPMVRTISGEFCCDSVWRCIEGCNAEWYRLLTKEEAAARKSEKPFFVDSHGLGCQ